MDYNSDEDEWIDYNAVGHKVRVDLVQRSKLFKNTFFWHQ